jgi:hypothetical protein
MGMFAVRRSELSSVQLAARQAENGIGMMARSTGSVCILTGPPGSGKSTAANEWARRPGRAKVHLHADDFWHFIKHGAIPPYLPEAHVQNGVVVDVLTKAAEGYATGGYLVILDGIIGPWFLEPFGTMNVPVYYIVLRPPLDVAIRRCRERGSDTLTDPAAITALYGQLADLGALERHALEIGETTREETLVAVLAAFESGSFLLRS